jgi:Holliday junction resolvase
MAKKEETIFKEKILPKLDRLGYFVKIQQTSIAGTPDILGTINGVFIAIELKTDDGEISELQGVQIYKIIKSGGIGLIVTPANSQLVFSFLASLKRNCLVKKSRKRLRELLQVLAVEIDKLS